MLGCSARAVAAAESLKKALSVAVFSVDEDPRYILGALVATGAAKETSLSPPSSLERAVLDAVQQSIGQGRGDTDEEVRASVIADLESFVSKRIVNAGQSTAAAAQELCEKRGYRRVAVYAGSGVTEIAVGLMSKSLENVTIIDSMPDEDGKGLAKRLAAREMFVRYGLLSAVEKLLEGVQILLLGADEIAMNGSIVVSAGAGIICALCNQKKIPVVVLAQSAKFSDNVVLGLETGGLDVLRPQEVEMIITEHGSVNPIMAPKVLEKTASYDVGRAVQM